jgi:hypothetical protein
MMAPDYHGRLRAVHRLVLMAWWLAPTSRWRTAAMRAIAARPNLPSAVASEGKEKPHRLFFGF